MSYEFMQYCYVTNDFDGAIAQIRATHGIGPFKELRDHHVPFGPGKIAVGHFALAFKAGLQFEIIQPLAGDEGFYQNLVTSGGPLEIKFHHLGRHIPTLARYREALGDMKKRWATPVDMAAFGGFYAYADSRADLGHYVELMCFPDAAAGNASPLDVPRYD